MKNKENAINRMEDLPLSLTVMEAAEVLRVGRDAVYQLVRSGELRSVKVGKQYRVPRDAVEEFLSK